MTLYLFILSTACTAIIFDIKVSSVTAIPLISSSNNTLHQINNLIKMDYRVKTNTKSWTTKNTTSSHYFSNKFKTNTLQGQKRCLKFFESEINNLRI